MDAAGLPLRSLPRRLRARGWRRPLLALLVVAAGTAILALSGTVAGTDATLQVMGFDPDRSILIAALIAEAIVVALATAGSRAPHASILGGAVAFAVLFGPTFRDETRGALRAHGATGVFDPVGWAATTVTLVVIVLVIGWAAASLALIVRARLLVAWADVVAIRHGDRSPARVVRPGSAVVIAALLAVTLPVFGDMVNFTPDVHMLTGASSNAVGLTQPTTNTVLPSGLTPLPPQVLDQPGIVAPSPGAPGAANPVLSQQRPWQAWHASGTGQVTQVSFKAPWTGGLTNTAEVSIYTPPGYSPRGPHAYPTLYEVPWNIGGWQTSGQLPTILDSLIDAGRIPPTIAVFTAEHGGPYPDSECANSADHREWYESFLTQTVVPYVDHRFHTMATPGARALVGFSQGGFCASMLVARHPDLFHSAISISGYFQAGLRSNETPNAWRPFAGEPALETAYSPLNLVPDLASTVRSSLFFELSASPTASVYGSEYGAFASVLHAADVPVALFPTRLGHSWTACRVQMPQLLETLFAHEAAQGVFG